MKIYKVSNLVNDNFRLAVSSEVALRIAREFIEDSFQYWIEEIDYRLTSSSNESFEEFYLRVYLEKLNSLYQSYQQSKSSFKASELVRVEEIDVAE